MFDLQPATEATALVEGGDAAHRELGDLVRELRAAGVEARLCRTRSGVAAGGVTLPVAVAEVLAGDDAGAWRAVIELVRAGVPATLALRELGPGEAATAALEAFAAGLRDRLLAAGLSGASLGMSLQSHVVPLEAYRILTSELLGGGPRYVILDALQMRPPPNPRAERAAANNWRFLWRCRATGRPLVPAYAAGVTTRCALLGDEAAAAILPELGLQVPAGSAWLPLVLRLPDFADARGRLDWERLRRALYAAVDLGEDLLDRLHWPRPELARDAAANRRLGIHLRGLGDLVVARGANPSDIGCLRMLDGVVARVQALLLSRSRALARERGPLPSLVRSEPTIGWSCDRSRSDWQERWRRALAESAVRHRNLLVLSPYSVLPRNARRASDYLDLLPVLDHADAFAFGDPRAACFGSARELACFHARAWAVMQRRHAASLVAAGV